ncbi:MAG: hypothetical protein LBP68_05995, partial [Acidobacteriota bacterium]|nr:hypothetical protein [Acidobacteriota bacterium]
MKVLSSCVFLFLCSVSGVLGQEFRGDAPPPVFAEAGTSALASKGAEAPPLEILFDVGESCRVDAVDDCDLQESPEP